MNMTPQNSKTFNLVLALIRELRDLDCDPVVVSQLDDFVHNYVTSVLEEARLYANNKNSNLAVEDVRLALHFYNNYNMVTAPNRKDLLKFAVLQNCNQLPANRVNCGLRLPTGRHCLSSCNYRLKHNKKTNFTGLGLRIIARPPNGVETNMRFARKFGSKIGAESNDVIDLKIKK